MELEKHWQEIKTLVYQAKKTCNHCAIATVDADGNPHVTPIGHIFLHDDMSGYYFDQYSQTMPKNFEHSRKICLLAVNSSRWFWLKSLFNAKFNALPGVRLFGEVGDKRDATPAEIAALHDATKIAHPFKGYDLLWKNLDKVRDIQFTDFKPVAYPVMMGDVLK